MNIGWEDDWYTRKKEKSSSSRFAVVGIGSLWYGLYKPFILKKGKENFVLREEEEWSLVIDLLCNLI